MLVTNFNLKYAIYKVILPIYQLFDTGRLHPVRERSIRALNESVDYIELNMQSAVGFETQKELITFSLNQVSVSGCYLEFGVFTGGTIRFMAKIASNQIFHGFDSFEGLPENWLGMPIMKNDFHLKGKLPKVPHNVKLHKGWFNLTLPKWREQNKENIAFIHIDCDLYSSTKEIFKILHDRFQAGTIVLFDEYFNYPNWKNHEFKAWQEFVRECNIKYEYIGFARQQVAVKITEMD